jgi:hypothetical protein
VALTATPFENTPLDLWAILSLLGFAGLWGRREFTDSFCREDIYPDGRRKVTGWKSKRHADQVMQWIGPRFLRRTSRDVGVRHQGANPTGACAALPYSEPRLPQGWLHPP